MAENCLTSHVSFREYYFHERPKLSQADDMEGPNGHEQISENDYSLLSNLSDTDPSSSNPVNREEKDLNLLTLPLELRWLIYSHLSHPSFGNKSSEGQPLPSPRPYPPPSP